MCGSSGVKNEIMRTQWDSGLQRLASEVECSTSSKHLGEIQTLLSVPNAIMTHGLSLQYTTLPYTALTVLHNTA